VLDHEKPESGAGYEPLADREALHVVAGAGSASAGVRQQGVQAAHPVVRQARGDGPVLGRRVSASSSQCLRGVFPPDAGPPGDPQSAHCPGSYMSAPDLHHAEAWHHLRATGHGRLRTPGPCADGAAFDPSGESLWLSAGSNTRGHPLFTVSLRSSSLEGQEVPAAPVSPRPSPPGSPLLKPPCCFLLHPWP
jgi:hypothetical protein